MRRTSITVAALVLAVGLLIGGILIWWEDMVVMSSQSTTPITRVTTYVSGKRLGGSDFCSVFHGVSPEVGNVAKGPSELVVISRTHGVHFDGDVQTWRDLPFDRHQVTLQDPIRVPVTVWRLAAPLRTVLKDLAGAPVFFVAQGTGISLEINRVDVSEAPKQADCDSLRQLQDLGLFREDAINVYYTESCGPLCEDAGISCRDEPRANFVYQKGDDTTLAHEIGHALLGQLGWNHWPDRIGTDNLMRDDEERTSLTPGQAVAMAFEKTGALALLGRSANPLDCLKNCPPLDFAYRRNSCATASAGDAPYSGRAVASWFSCVECTDGQLERVLVDGQRDALVVEELVDGLRQLSMEDPILAPLHPAYRENALARRQIRALIALDRLARTDHPRAQQAIRSMAAIASNNLRNDVRSTLQAVLPRP